MPRIYTGTFAALEERLLACIADLQANDPLAPVAVLVGSNLLSACLNGRMADTRPAANVRFYTFADLAPRLAAGHGKAGARPRLPRLGASLLLEEILEKNTPGVFARVSGFAGFRGALLDTFRDLRDAGITPGILESALTEIRGLTHDRLEHLQALAYLYRGFRSRIAPFHDLAEDFERACRGAAAAGRVLGTHALLVYGIYDVTGIQEKLLLALQQALDLTYFVPFTDEASSHFAAPFVAARARDLGIAPEALEPRPGNDSLAVLAGRVFAPPASGRDPAPPPLAADGSFALVSVPGESRMAVEVVREVVRAVRDGVIAGFHEAAVVVRQPEEEAPALAEAFRLRGIPCFVHGGSAFSRRPLARAVLAITGLEAESYSRRAILNAMELIAAALPENPTDWDVPEWRALVNDPRFIAGLDSWDRGTEALLGEARAQLRRAEENEQSGAVEEGADEGKTESVARARRRQAAASALHRGWQALRRAAADWPAACSWRQWSDVLRDRFQPLLGRAGDWQSFSSIFDDFACLSDLPHDAGAGGPVTRSRFTAALSEALAGLSFPEGRFQRSGVNIISVAAARGLPFPLVIVPGLDEGRFPARLRQDPLLLDAERSQIGKKPRLPLKSLRGEEEKLLFQLVMRSAGKRLVVMTSRLDEASDRERIPSQFFLRCAAAARGSALNLKDLTPENVPGLRSVSLDDPGPGRDQVAVDKGEIRLGLIAAQPARAHAALAAIHRLEPTLMGGPMSYDQARWLRLLTPFDGRIHDSALRSFIERKLGAGASQLSASRIEEYAKCPYFFYLRRIHELEKWDEEERMEGIDPLLRGQIIHAILEEFVREFRGAGFTAGPLPVLQQRLADLARRELEKNRPAGLPDLLWEIETGRLMKMLGKWLEFEIERAAGHLIPAHVERTFGTFQGAAESPPFQAAAGGRLFEFRGRIDRIDVGPDGRSARIIDYKTGSLPQTMSAKKTKMLLMAGEKIQLAVYCGALRGMEDLKDVSAAAAEYLHLQPRDGKTVPCAFDDAAMQAAAGRLPQMLEIIHSGIAGGVFFARTSGSVRPDGHCEYCDFLLICGKDRMQREEYKAEDPAVAEFQQLAAIDGGTAEDEE